MAKTIRFKKDRPGSRFFYVGKYKGIKVELYWHYSSSPTGSCYDITVDGNCTPERGSAPTLKKAAEIAIAFIDENKKYFKVK